MSLEHTFVFADLAGYTALTEAHGDHDAARIATHFHDLARTALPPQTQLVKTIGDAVMLVSPRIEDGIAAALSIAGMIKAQESFPALRVGIHAGPAVERDLDYFGSTVNIAARVSSIARGGEIVCTEVVAAVAIDRGLASVRPMGTVRLKNVATPIALFELNPGSPAEAMRHIDPVCRMQVVAQQAPVQTQHDGTTFYFCSLGCAARFKAAPESYVPVAAE